MESRENTVRGNRPDRPEPSMRAGALLRTVRHHRRTRPVLAALLIAGSILGLRVEHDRSAAIRAQWGVATTAWVATADFEAGHLLRDGDLEARSLPPAAVPPDATTEPPYGNRLADPIGRGEVIRLGRLRGSAASANASRVGPGRGALALNTVTAHLEVGDRVDLHALIDGEVVAADAEVIAVSEGVPVVAIDDADLVPAIRAFTLGDVVPVLVG